MDELGGKRGEQEGITSDDLPLAPREEQLAAPSSYHISMPSPMSYLSSEPSSTSPAFILPLTSPRPVLGSKSSPATL